jgi:hypothetical protein
MSADNLKQKLARVLWIGGAPDAGKSSVARIVATKFGLWWYNFDYFEPAHIERMDAAAHPATAAFLAMTLDERWVLRSVEAMTRTTIAMWRERFALMVEDLLAWPHDGPILAEGPGLFPECVAPLLSNPRQALWLVPDDTFKRAVYPTRENKIATSVQTSDPPRARSNMIGRDLMLGEHIKDQAHALGLTVFDVDGTRSIDDMAAATEEHFRPLLDSFARRLPRAR